MLSAEAKARGWKEPGWRLEDGVPTTAGAWADPVFKFELLHSNRRTQRTFLTTLAYLLGTTYPLKRET